VVWALPNCVTHPFLVPALELYVDSFCRLQVPAANEVTVCTETAIKNGRVVGASGNEKTITLALSTEIWESATVGDHLIRDLIGSFVDPVRVPPASDYGDGNAIVLTESCSGPNCHSKGSTTVQNFCQSLVTIEDEFQGVPVGLQVPLGLFLCAFMACFFLRLLPTNRNKNSSSVDEDPLATPVARGSLKNMFSSMRSSIEPTVMVDQVLGIKIEKLTASTQEGQPLLTQVNLDLRPGSVNGLLGRSGSG